MTEIKEHDSVALLEDVRTEHSDTRRPIILPRGSVGTVVLEHSGGEAFEVEFSGSDGCAYAMLALKPEQLLLLHYSAAQQAA